MFFADEGFLSARAQVLLRGKMKEENPCLKKGKR
jgi:hypothetical protein